MVGWGGIVCLLMIFLWVRSCWWIDRLSGFLDGDLVAVSSELGVVGIWYLPGNFRTEGTTDWRLDCWPATPYPYSWLGKYRFEGDAIIALFPYWLVTSMIIAVAATPWIRLFPQRFSLRTLFIAVTLVSIVLGTLIFLFN